MPANSDEKFDRSELYKRWGYSSDGELKALEYAKNLAFKVAPPGHIILRQEIEGLARFLFPDEFKPLDI